MALNAERISVFLVRCMLGLFLALMALGLALGALQTAQQTQAFLCGLLAAAALAGLLNLLYYGSYLLVIPRECLP